MARALIGVLARPSGWLALAVLATPFSSAGGPSSAAVTASDLALVVAVALAGAGLLRGRGLGLLRTVPAVGFWVLGAVSATAALVATNYPSSLVGGVRFLQLFCLVPIAVLVALRNRLDVVVVLGALVGLALVEGAIGVAQTVTATGAGIGGDAVRAVGTFGAYNIAALADLCALALVVCLALAVVLPGRPRWLAVAAAAFLALPLAFSLTRAAWLAAAVAVVVVLSRGRLPRLVATLVPAGVLGAVGLSVLVATGSELGQRVSTLFAGGAGPDQSLLDRFALWDAAARMALDHPLTGIGPRAFPAHRDAYADLSLLGSSDISFGGDFQRVALESPHNFYLLVASEQGLVAAFAYVTVFLVLLARGLVRSARHRSDLSTAVALAGVGMLTFALVGMVSGDLGGPGSIYVALAVGMAGWAAADRDLLPDAPRRAPSRYEREQAARVLVGAGTGGTT